MIDNTITLNESLFSNSTEHPLLKSIIYHEYFHFIQDNYDDSVFGNIWFHEATASYYEAKQLNQDFTGTTSKNYELQFDSIIPTINTDNAGYARAPLIAYISNCVGNDDWIKELYKNGEPSDDEILNFISSISVTFATEYYIEIAKGTIGEYPAYTFHNMMLAEEFSNKVGGVIKPNIPDLTTITTAVESGNVITLGTKEFVMNGDGCRIVTINMSNDDFKDLPEDTKISFVGDNDYFIQVIRSKGKTCECVSNELLVADLKTALVDGYRYTVVLVTYGQSNKTYETHVSMLATPVEKVPEGSVTSEYYSDKYRFSGHNNELYANIIVTITADRPFTIRNKYQNVESVKYTLLFNGISTSKPVNLTIKVELSGYNKNTGETFDVVLTSSSWQWVDQTKYMTETLTNKTGTNSITDIVKFTYTGKGNIGGVTFKYTDPGSDTLMDFVNINIAGN